MVVEVDFFHVQEFLNLKNALQGIMKCLLKNWGGAPPFLHLILLKSELGSISILQVLAELELRASPLLAAHTKQYCGTTAVYSLGTALPYSFSVLCMLSSTMELARIMVGLVCTKTAYTHTEMTH